MEGPTVHIPHCRPQNGSATLPFVIPTGAWRSGGICSSADLPWKCFRPSAPATPHEIRQRVPFFARESRTKRTNALAGPSASLPYGRDDTSVQNEQKNCRSPPRYAPGTDKRTIRSSFSSPPSVGRGPRTPPFTVEMRRKCYKKMEADSSLSCANAIEWRPGTNRIAD